MKLRPTFLGILEYKHKSLLSQKKNVSSMIAKLLLQVTELRDIEKNVQSDLNAIETVIEMFKGGDTDGD